MLTVKHLPEVNPEPRSPRHTSAGSCLASPPPPSPPPPPSGRQQGLTPIPSKEQLDFILTRNLLQPMIKRNELMSHRTTLDPGCSQSRDSSDSRDRLAFPSCSKLEWLGHSRSLASSKRRYAKMFSEGQRETLFYSFRPTPGRW